MYQKKENKVTVKDIANFLNVKYTGKNFYVNSISSLNKIKKNSILFYSEFVNVKFKVKDDTIYDLKKLEKITDVVVIADTNLRKQIKVPILPSKHPRYDFYRVLTKFFAQEEFQNEIHETAVIEKKAKIGKNVFVGSNCYIGNNVTIGNNCKILHNACIFGETTIGRNSVISSNTTVGSEGFGFSYTGEELYHFPHIGKIVIGNNVWIGSNCTVEKAQIDDTRIGNNVKIDDLVHIGHNSQIKSFSQITAGVIIAGKVKIGKGCWIASNSMIDNGCRLGDNCMVGSSSLVRTNFSKNSIIAGVPAKLLRNFKQSEFI